MDKVSTVAKKKDSSVLFEKTRTKSDIDQVIEISHSIWNEYYIPIFGKDKVEHILKNFFTKKVIIENIKSKNHRYYLIKFNDKVVGYLGFQFRDNDILLHNIYLCPKHRGLRIGRRTMRLLQKIAKRRKYETLLMRVNKENLEAIIAAHRLGFKKIGEVSRNIGGSYVMNNLIMEHPVN